MYEVDFNLRHLFLTSPILPGHSGGFYRGELSGSDNSACHVLVTVLNVPRHLLHLATEVGSSIIPEEQVNEPTWRG